jgi:hypothetical protein
MQAATRMLQQQQCDFLIQQSHGLLTNDYAQEILNSTGNNLNVAVVFVNGVVSAEGAFHACNKRLQHASLLHMRYNLERNKFTATLRARLLRFSRRVVLQGVLDSWVCLAGKNIRLHAAKRAWYAPDRLKNEVFLV